MSALLRIFPLYYGVLALVFFVAPLIPLLRGAEVRALGPAFAGTTILDDSTVTAVMGTGGFPK